MFGGCGLVCVWIRWLQYRLWCGSSSIVSLWLGSVWEKYIRVLWEWSLCNWGIGMWRVVQLSLEGCIDGKLFWVVRGGGGWEWGGTGKVLLGTS